VSHQTTSDDVKELCECLACGSHEHLVPVLDLGEQPLANSFKLKQLDVQRKYPLAINRCTNCNHIQLTHAVDPKLMFEDYLYVSGTAKTMHSHFELFAALTDEIQNSVSNQKRAEEKTVLDIGCNDGTQLDYYKKLGYKTFGVDPAKNLCILSSKNHTVYCDWFNESFAKKFKESHDDIRLDTIVAQNVFAHGSDPLGFLNAAKLLMGDETTLHIQTSQSRMIQNNEFDTIYHEHISFFNVSSMKTLCERAGLVLNSVHHMDIHGTSYVFSIGKSANSTNDGSVERQLFLENLDGIYTAETYVKYAARCDEIVRELKQAVSNYTRLELGWLAVGYGAPAKGMTLLNYSGLNLDFIIDDNPLKQGRFTPGSSIPIYSSEKLKEFPDALCFVPLAWNFFDEIVKKIKTQRDNPYDRFVTYFPTVKDVS
jgi:hypothetical protein